MIRRLSSLLLLTMLLAGGSAYAQVWSYTGPVAPRTYIQPIQFYGTLSLVTQEGVLEITNNRVRFDEFDFNVIGYSYNGLIELWDDQGVRAELDLTDDMVLRLVINQWGMFREVFIPWEEVAAQIGWTQDPAQLRSVILSYLNGRMPTAFSFHP